jgi:hypothetical protein
MFIWPNRQSFGFSLSFVLNILVLLFILYVLDHGLVDRFEFLNFHSRYFILSLFFFFLELKSMIAFSSETFLLR